MSYATLMVHLTAGQSNAKLLDVTADLAQQFQARVIGVAACQPLELVYAYGYAADDLIERDRKEKLEALKTLEKEFHDRLHAHVHRLEWRGSLTAETPATHLATEARGADLVIIGSGPITTKYNISAAADIGDLVLQAGRPVLIVPEAIASLNPHRVVIGWNDSRECRRAIVDALPFLRHAAHVSIVEIADKGALMTAREHLNDVAAWLKSHGITASLNATTVDGSGTNQLESIADEDGADLIVAGAYGHSRVREWILGGMTDDLLHQSDRCSLLSH